jgi:hypothetical protein
VTDLDVFFWNCKIDDDQTGADGTGSSSSQAPGLGRHMKNIVTFITIPGAFYASTFPAVSRRSVFSPSESRIARLRVAIQRQPERMPESNCRSVKIDPALISQAMLFYWTTTSALTLLQASVLKLSAVKRYLRIPEIKPVAPPPGGFPKDPTPWESVIALRDTFRDKMDEKRKAQLAQLKADDARAIREGRRAGTEAMANEVIKEKVTEVFDAVNAQGSAQRQRAARAQGSARSQEQLPSQKPALLPKKKAGSPAQTKGRKATRS